MPSHTGGTRESFTEFLREACFDFERKKTAPDPLLCCGGSFPDRLLTDLTRKFWSFCSFVSCSYCHWAEERGLFVSRNPVGNWGKHAGKNPTASNCFLVPLFLQKPSSLACHHFLVGSSQYLVAAVVHWFRRARMVWNSSCMASQRVGEAGLSNSGPSHHHHHNTMSYAVFRGLNPPPTSFMYCSCPCH